MIRSTTLSESARITSTVGRFGPTAGASRRARGDHQDAAVGLRARRTPDDVVRLDRLEAERSMTLDRLVAELRGQRAAERQRASSCAAGAARRTADAARNDAAAAVVRCAERALAGAAGALLAIRLLAAAGDLAAGLRVVRARPAAGELGGHDLVEHGRVDRRREQLIVELDVADGLRRSGRTAWSAACRPSSPRINAAARAGDAAGDEQQVPVGVGAHDAHLLDVTRSSPMWPAIRRPGRRGRAWCRGRWSRAPGSGPSRGSWGRGGSCGA